MLPELTFTDILLIALLWTNIFTLIMLAYSHLPKRNKPVANNPVLEPKLKPAKTKKKSISKDPFYDKFLSELGGDNEGEKQA